MSSSKSLQEVSNEKLVSSLILATCDAERFQGTCYRFSALVNQKELREEILRRMASTPALPNDSQCTIILKIAKNYPCGAVIPTDDIEVEITLGEFLQDMRTRLDKFEEEIQDAK